MVQWLEFDVANVAIRVRFPVGADNFFFFNKKKYIAPAGARTLDLRYIRPMHYQLCNRSNFY